MDVTANRIGVARLCWRCFCINYGHLCTFHLFFFFSSDITNDVGSDSVYIKTFPASKTVLLSSPLLSNYIPSHVRRWNISELLKRRFSCSAATSSLCTVAVCSVPWLDSLYASAITCLSPAFCPEEASEVSGESKWPISSCITDEGTIQKQLRFLNRYLKVTWLVDYHYIYKYIMSQSNTTFCFLLFMATCFDSYRIVFRPF